MEISIRRICIWPQAVSIYDLNARAAGLPRWTCRTSAPSKLSRSSISRAMDVASIEGQAIEVYANGISMTKATTLSRFSAVVVDLIAIK